MSSYIDTPENQMRGIYDPGHSWAEHCARRLVHAHGQERADSIADGQDAASEQDIAAWRSFGSSKRVAA